MRFKEEVLDVPINGERRTVADVGADNGSVPVRRRRILAALAGLLALALSACGTGGASTDASTAPTAAGNSGTTVAIQDMAYTPETLTVEAGATVTWVWADGAIAHDVAGDGFKSEVMSEGTFSHRFDQPGTYDYVCSLHPNMTGAIEVTG
jgi:plastocyanin